jgi:hypothetical protein
MLVYKTIIRPNGLMVYKYGDPTNPSNIRSFQSFQAIALRLLTGTSWFITNSSLHNDFRIHTVSELTKI